MTLSTWLLYSGVALLTLLSPGPAILLAVSNSVTFGFHRVPFSTLGNITGVFLISACAMLGMGAVLKTSTLLFLLLKILGAAYLIYLGLCQWRSRKNVFLSLAPSATRAQLSDYHLFRRGLLVALTNPKAILFFTALFPQFVDPQKNLVSQFFILTSTFMFFSFLSLMGYAFLARSARSWFTNDHRALWFNRFSGGAFVCLGLALLKLKN